MGHTDRRVKLTSEVIAGIKAIKLYAWEQPYEDRILKIREVAARADLMTHSQACPPC